MRIQKLFAQKRFCRFDSLPQCFFVIFLTQFPWYTVIFWLSGWPNTKFIAHVTLWCAGRTIFTRIHSNVHSHQFLLSFLSQCDFDLCILVHPHMRNSCIFVWFWNVQIKKAILTFKKAWKSTQKNKFYMLHVRMPNTHMQHSQGDPFIGCESFMCFWSNIHIVSLATQ